MNIYSSYIINVPDWKQPSSPSTDECVNKLVHLFKNAVKGNELSRHQKCEQALNVHYQVKIKTTEYMTPIIRYLQ